MDRMAFSDRLNDVKYALYAMRYMAHAIIENSQMGRTEREEIELDALAITLFRGFDDVIDAIDQMEKTALKEGAA